MQIGGRRTAIIAAIGLVLCTRDARADIGLPMVAIYLPPAWLCFIPIVVIEAYFGIARFKLPLRKALLAQAVANALSTGVGLPVTWIILAVLQMSCCGYALGLDSFWKQAYAVTVQAPWLIPYESDLHWMVPVAFATLTAPFYLVSVVLEYFVVRRFFPNLAKDAVRVWVTRANLLSYAFLLAIMLLGMVWPTAFEWASGLFAPVTRFMFGLVYRIIRGQQLPF